MLFRPNYCANCGAKIERAEWRMWTSRRFCQVCETQFKGQDLIPRAVVVLGALAGIIGLGSYFARPTPEKTAMPDQARRFVESPARNMAATASGTSQVANAAANPEDVRPANGVSERLISANTPETPAATEETKYYCGAATKKGTPCSRKVKGNVRCYQHEGMPAMLPASKLRIS